MPPNFARVRPGWHSVGRNPISLTLIAATAVWRGENYLTEGIPPGSLPPIESVSGFIPVRLWAVLWIISGITMLVGMVWRRPFALGSSCVATLWALWGIAFIASSMFDSASVSSSAEITGAGFLALGVAAWSLASAETDYDDEQRAAHG